MKQEIGNAQTGIMRTQVISIIIPTLNEASTIEQFLKSLRERAGDVEIIVVDGGSSDDTFDLARDRCDQCLRSARGRALQMNTGAAAASGDIFWFLHADTEVPADCVQKIYDVLRDPEVAGGFFRIRIPSRRFVYRLTDSFAHYAGLLLQMRFGDHGFFCRRAVFREIGGFPQLPLMEDAEFFPQASPARSHRNYLIPPDLQPAALRADRPVAFNAYIWADRAPLFVARSDPAPRSHLSKHLRVGS